MTWRVSLAVLVLVIAFALLLRRSITRPLADVSEGARRLSSGELASDVPYAGRDEIGDVAAAFRDLRVTAERFAEEIRAMNVAIEDNRLEHRADVRALDGTWARLLQGMNATMEAVAGLQSRRRRAEREAADIFDLSLDLLCIAGVDGYFKRVNPAFERTLGYSSEELLSRPVVEFIHPDDRERTSAAIESQARGESVVQFENRYIHRDGSLRWIQWNSRPAPDEQGLIYAAARDVTDSRRAREEQTALRRVATLVAEGSDPADLFEAVAVEVGRLLDADATRLLRYEDDGTATVVAAYGSSGPAVDVGVRLPSTACASSARAPSSRPRSSSPAVPWGVIVASFERPDAVRPDTEARMAQFTELVATAVANAESSAELAASRRRIVETADETRRRIERNLHDGAQQRLVHTIISLKLARGTEDGNGRPTAELVGEGLEHAEAALAEMRELARGIHPAILSERGLVRALEALAERSPVPVALEAHVDDGLPERVEVTAYYVASEALANVAKHAKASSVAGHARSAPARSVAAHHRRRHRRRRHRTRLGPDGPARSRRGDRRHAERRQPPGPRHVRRRRASAPCSRARVETVARGGLSIPARASAAAIIGRRWQPPSSSSTTTRAFGRSPQPSWKPTASRSQARPATSAKAGQQRGSCGQTPRSSTSGCRMAAGSRWPRSWPGCRGRRASSWSRATSRPPTSTARGRTARSCRSCRRRTCRARRCESCWREPPV